MRYSSQGSIKYAEEKISTIKSAIGCKLRFIHHFAVDFDSRGWGLRKVQVCIFKGLAMAHKIKSVIYTVKKK